MGEVEPKSPPGVDINGTIDDDPMIGFDQPQNSMPISVEGIDDNSTFMNPAHKAINNHGISEAVNGVNNNVVGVNFSDQIDFVSNGVDDRISFMSVDSTEDSSQQPSNDSLDNVTVVVR